MGYNNSPAFRAALPSDSSATSNKAMPDDLMQNLKKTTAASASILVAEQCGGSDVRRRYSAGDLWNQAQLDNIEINGYHNVLQLTQRRLLENDSAGAGAMLPGVAGLNYMELNAATGAGKTFQVEKINTLGVRLAVLVVAPAPAAPLEVAINGNVRRYMPPAPAFQAYGFVPPTAERCGGYAAPRRGGGFNSAWLYLDFPADWLRIGLNHVLLQSPAESGAWRIAVANRRPPAGGSMPPEKDLPRASQLGARDAEGKITWTELDGEYSIRLSLDGFRNSGELITPVIDLAQTGAPWADLRVAASVETSRLVFDAETPPGTRMEYRIRTSDNPWLSCDGAEQWALYRNGDTLASPGRFLRCRIRMATDDPGYSPRLRGMAAAAKIKTEQPPWTAALRRDQWRNSELATPSHKYANEHYDHPDLRQLRAKFELDRVVEGARDEFGLVLRLLNWAYRVPIKDIFAHPEISWNALDYLVLERDANGAIIMNRYQTRRRDGFCLISNLALMQALLSFGIPARHIAIGGHEVCEVWSNEHDKWVHLDATREFYCYDRRTRAPLNVLEIHRLYVSDPDRIGVYTGMDNPQLLDLKALCEGHHNLLSMMALMRIIPRNNFLAQPFPHPFNHGYRWPWPWNGYLNWEGDGVAPQWHYGCAVKRERDFYWPLNRVGFVMQAGAQPGTVEVRLDHVMPDFECYEAGMDGGPWRDCAFPYCWELHPGRNSIKFRARNRMGVCGAPSEAALVWHDGG